MAKAGEGDPRWIVEERSDGTNVNNWHWFVFFDLDRQGINVWIYYYFHTTTL